MSITVRVIGVWLVALLLLGLVIDPPVWIVVFTAPLGFLVGWVASAAGRSG